VFVLFCVSILIFLMIHLVPGDPVTIMLHESTVGTDAIDRDGVPDTFGTRKGILRGDFGRSIFKRAPVIDIIVDKFPRTLKLALSVMIIAMPLGILAGVIAAVKRETVFDYATTVGALAGVSLPSFWLGLMLMFVFGVDLGWIRPYVGDRGLVTLILPTITLAAPSVAIISRLTRSSMLNVLGEDYIRTARAKGVMEMLVLSRHALRNALIPVVTIMGLQFGYLLGGAVIVETVFVYPGLGSEVVTAILNRDFPMVQGIILVSAASFVFINLAIDLLYTVIDPRIQYN
jgi:peptide/nickel transport system permease protein